MTRYLGGLITADETQVIPADNFEDTSAPGVWTLSEAEMLTKQGKWPTAGLVGKLAFFFGGNSGSGELDTIQKLNLSTTGNATDFGDLSAVQALAAAVGTPTRCVYGGVTDNVGLEYITTSTTGDTTTFGDLSRANDGSAAIGNSTYGLFAPRTSSTLYDYERITIASTGNATDFGDVNVVAYNFGGGVNNTTIGLIFGGYDSDLSANTDAISQKSITSSGNATDFGNLTQATDLPAGACSSTRGVIGGGNNASPNVTDVIAYVTIASAGNAVDFGNLSVAKEWVGAASSTTTAVFAGGYTGSSTVDTIDSIVIASIGNATDFGDLVGTTNRLTGVGTRHGGIS